MKLILPDYHGKGLRLTKTVKGQLAWYADAAALPFPVPADGARAWDLATDALAESDGTRWIEGGAAVAPVPVVTSYDVAQAQVGDTVIITGARFLATAVVLFSGVACSTWTVDSDTQITAEVPAGASTGPVTVDNGAGLTGQGPSFTVLVGPTIESMVPTSGPPGTSVTFTGTGMAWVSTVEHAGVSWSITSQDDGELVAVAAEGYAVSAPVTLTSPYGTDDSGPFALHVLAYDLAAAAATPAVLPPGITVAMSPAPARVVATSPSTAAVVATPHTYDQRGGIDGLWAAWPAYVDEAWPGAYDPLQGNTIDVVASAAPDGASDAHRFNRDNGSFGIVDIVGSQVSDATRPAVTQLWVRDDPGNPPSAPGALATYQGSFNARSLGGVAPPLYTPGNVHLGSTPGSQWRRIVVARTASGFAGMRFFGDGLQPPSETYHLGGNAAGSGGGTGAYLVAFPSAVKAYADIPPIAAPSGPTSVGALSTEISGDALTGVVTPGGIIDLDLDWVESQARSSSGFTAVADTRYLFRMATPSGDWWLRANGRNLAASVRGSTGSFGTIDMGVPLGEQPMRARLRNDPGGNRATVRVWTNGCRNSLFDRTTTSPGSNAAPTAFHLGSDLAGADPLPRLFSRVRRRLDAESVLDDEEIAILGDSTTGLEGSTPPVGEHIYIGTEAWERPGIVSYSVAGDTVAGQTAKWDAGPSKGNAAIKAIVILGWYNDINAGTSAADVITAYAALIASMRSSNPTAKIVLCTMVPSLATLTAAEQTEFLALQDAILGLGPTPLDADGRVDMRAALDTDSSGTIDAAFSTDNLHPKMLARHEVMGPAIRAELVAQGVL